jgi:NAD(P)-dependent dehydrogenase (short-subunit alcohol dehydrogenase family)
MTDRFALNDKTAIVTGGAGLIGQAVSESLAEHGATTIVADIEPEIDDSHAQAGELIFETVDVTDPDQVDALFERVRSEQGTIDILVNCAYPRNEAYGQAYEEMTLADWRENVDLHLNSYFYSAFRASLAMKEQPHGGSIVNFASIYGVRGPNFTIYEDTDITSPVEYSAIKGGILSLTRYMASYLGEYGVRVNAVSPGGVYDEQPSAFVDAYERQTPLGRMADPEDIVGAVVYLASDAAGYVTGHNLVVDGGWTSS